MAQWMWQYLGFTHETKAQELEDALRAAIASTEAVSDEKLPKQLRRIKKLADRLLSTRIKILKRHGSTKVEEVRRAGFSAIVEEFDLESALQNREARQAEQNAAEQPATAPQSKPK